MVSTCCHNHRSQHYLMKLPFPILTNSPLDFHAKKFMEDSNWSLITMVIHNKRFLATFALTVYLLAPFFAPQLASSESIPTPNFAFSWSDGNGTFEAGELATVKVKVLGEFQRAKYKNPFNPYITVNNKMGNSTFISGVSTYFGDDLNNWRISFIPIRVGLFNLLISDENFKVLDSSLHFQVSPGKRYPAAGTVSWLDGVDEFVAGMKATILLLLKDPFGNNISAATEGEKSYNFSLSVSHLNGSVATVLNITNEGWNQLGYLSIEFIVAMSGSFLLNVQEQSETLIGSPLSLEVKPGILEVSKCLLHFDITTKYFQLFSVMEASINQLDLYGNPVPGWYAFDVEVLQKGSNLSVPISDLHFKEGGLGIQDFSFKLYEPGDFLLLVSRKGQKGENNLISNVPYDFTVYIGYCDGKTSIVNGSGLNDSFAGETARFSVFLRDEYLYPSPVNLESLQVQIQHESDSKQISSNIRPLRTVNGSGILYSPSSHQAMTPTSVINGNNESLGNAGLKFSAFKVSFVPEKCGIYEISVFCGNIQLNSGLPFRKVVNAGNVNVSVSEMVKFAPKVSKQTKNEVVVQLMDSYSNPVQMQQSKLKLEVASVNRSGFSTLMFVDNKDGSYTGSYIVKDVGSYEICPTYEGQQLIPCPFGVNAYSSEYFPKVSNDTVHVWEDESIAFDALENDYFAGGNASVVEFSKPRHGSLLQNGHLFRYTSYEGFYGNDSFVYTIADINGNTASGSVNISVLSVPPKFVSFPSLLQGTEDRISSMFGGFSGFEMIYSDLKENITLIISAESGTVFLAATKIQFWLPIWDELYVKNDSKKDKQQLILSGSLDVVNFALQGIQYFGNKNFYGKDTIRVTTMNRNGKSNVDFPIFVEPINDPPYINVPTFIVLEDSRDDVLIYNAQKDKFDFFIGDPDLVYFPGNKFHFSVVFSVEVSSGYLITSLPSDLVNVTEIKMKTSYQWQPLQTFVSIEKHFTVKAKGVRFWGTVDVCNHVMQNLLYHGGEHDAVLTVKVNDMGNYGCYPNCNEIMSASLSAEATVTLVKGRLMSSLLAHSLGSVVMVEFIVVLFLGLLLLLFLCKCAFVLIRDKRRHEAQEIELATVQNSYKQVTETDLAGETTPFSDCLSSPFLIRDQPFIEGSCNEKNGTKESKQQEDEEEDIHNSAQLSSNGDELQMNTVIPVTDAM